ncbi:hypothetical protein ACK3YF_08755, partial [Aeromonas allosaccharophila]
MVLIFLFLLVLIVAVYFLYGKYARKINFSEQSDVALNNSLIDEYVADSSPQNNAHRGVDLTVESALLFA